MQLTWFDAVVAGVLIFATVRGAIKGLVWQLAWIAAILLSFAFSGSASVVIAGAIPLDPPLNRWVAMFALYVGAAIVSFAVAHRLKDWIEKRKIQEFDKHFGAIFGFVKGAILSLIFVFFSVTLSPGIRETALHSYTGYASAVVMEHLHAVMPEEFLAAIHPYIHTLDEAAGNEHQHADEVHGQGAGKSITKPAAEKPPQAAIADPGPAAIDSAAIGAASGAMNESDFERERRLLLERIASRYAVFPDAQLAVIEEIELRFVGIPDAISMAVMKDWNSDLFGLRPDPDPTTDIRTTLSIRIQRQLASAGIEPRTLESANRTAGENPNR